MGAREREEAPPALEEARRAEVDLLIAAHGAVELGPAPREGRRIEDDHAEVPAGALEPAELVERVRGDELGSLGDSVERQVLARAHERLRRGLDQERAPGAATERVAREARRVAEGVEDVTAGGEPGDPAAVLSLVEVEARLVAHADRHGEPDAVFAHLDARRPRAPGPAVSGLEPLEPRRPVLVLVEDGQPAQHAPERPLDLPPPSRHPERPALDDEHGAVAV